MKRIPTHPHVAAGFSLVEVMVAVVVICVGLLGIAKMQAMSLSNTNMSRQRSLAAISAASMASAMHSNRDYWGNLSVQVTASISGTTAAPVFNVAGDAALQAATPAALNACVANDTVTAMCGAPVNLAAFDLTRWWVSSVSVELPNPTATVFCPQVPAGNAAPVSCQVTISWTEKAIAMNTQEANQSATETSTSTPSAAEQPTFTLYVEP